MSESSTEQPIAATEDCELSVVLPCLNEAETLVTCIDKAARFFARTGTKGEIVVADNGSTDGSQELARNAGARVVPVKDRGYGAALLGGIEAARGRYIVMADSDDSYDLENLEGFLAKLRDGFDLVMGNRFKGGIKPGAMPPLHRYLGNPVLSGLGRLFFRSSIRDFHCGIRGFRKDAITAIDLQTTGMEFASEMVVKAVLGGLRVTEVPTTLSPDGRSRPPHLRSWRDGWRHLRFLLLYSPAWLFLYPGLLGALIGLGVMLALLGGPVRIGTVSFDIHSMLYGAVLCLLGLQSATFGLFSKVYAARIGFLPQDRRVTTLLKLFTLERGLLAGLALTLCGLVGSLYAIVIWGERSFGNLLPSSMMRIAIPSLTALAAGVQIVLASFFLGVLSVGHRGDSGRGRPAT
jgi:glycosyltransferase involved in cell wall biosynthesis